jgi:predicted alpha/beta superfamily hydrolase
VADRRAKVEGRLRLHDNLIVYLPPAYSDRAGRYPVLYMQDGQNLFDPDTAFAGQAWDADAIADDLIDRGELKPLIIAGIYHSGVTRIEEYTEGRRYLDHLVRNVKPFVERTYRTDRTAAIGGSSLGGLVSIRAGLEYPRIFRKLAALSPSVWWDDRSIVRMVNAYRSTLRAKIWLDAGTDEGPDTIPDLRLLRDALLAKNWGENLQYHEVPGADHSERAWRARLGDVLRYLFPA